MTPMEQEHEKRLGQIREWIGNDPTMADALIAHAKTIKAGVLKLAEDEFRKNVAALQAEAKRLGIPLRKRGPKPEPKKAEAAKK